MRQVRASLQVGAITTKEEGSQSGGKSKAGQAGSQALLLQGTQLSGRSPPPSQEKETKKR